MQLSNVASSSMAWVKPRRSKVFPGADTSGDGRGKLTPEIIQSLSTQGAMSGAVQGLISGSQLGGPGYALVGAAAGAVGGFAGANVGFNRRSYLAAQAVGGATGAAMGAGLSVGLSLLLSHQAPAWTSATSVALLGGMAGLVGTLTASRSSVTRDSVTGGYGIGQIAQAAYTHNPLGGIASAVAAGWAGRAQTLTGQAIIASTAGAAMGALTVLPYFLAGNPQAVGLLADNVITGATTATLGTVIGPAFRQLLRNGSDELTYQINTVLDPVVQKHPLSTNSKTAVGGAVGGMFGGMLGSLSPALGLPLGVSMAATAGVGALAGAIKVRSLVKKQEPYLRTADLVTLYAPAWPTMKAWMNEAEKSQVPK